MIRKLQTLSRTVGRSIANPARQASCPSPRRTRMRGAAALASATGNVCFQEFATHQPLIQVVQAHEPNSIESLLVTNRNGECMLASAKTAFHDKTSAATFSPCRAYRYSLLRVWDSKLATVLFIGLNPSTADEMSDDPTVRRCIGFAKRWGFGRLILANLFAFRSTDPAALSQVSDPIGPANDNWLTQLRAAAEVAVVAWGANGSLLERDASVLKMLGEVQCLGKTRSGAPRHPLYLASDTPLRRYS